jgi:hypothetical protein
MAADAAQDSCRTSTQSRLKRPTLPLLAIGMVALEQPSWERDVMQTSSSNNTAGCRGSSA